MNKTIKTDSREIVEANAGVYKISFMKLTKYAPTRVYLYISQVVKRASCEPKICSVLTITMVAGTRIQVPTCLYGIKINVPRRTKIAYKSNYAPNVNTS